MRKFPRAIEKPSTVPLYREHGATIDFEGSGILFRVRGSHFLATAAHSADRRRNEEAGHGLHIGGGEHVIVIQRPVMVTRRFEEHCDPHLAPDDVCLVKLFDDEAAYLSERCSFIEEHEIEGFGPVSPSRLYSILGYPIADNRAEEMLQTVTANAIRIPAFQHSSFVDVRVSARPDWYVPLRYEESDYWQSSSGIGAPTKLGGFSGGAIWRDNLDFMQPSFAGMIIEHDEGQKAVLGVSAKGIVTLLNCWWKKLHELPAEKQTGVTPPDPGTHPGAGI